MNGVDASRPPRGGFVYAAAALMLVTALYACRRGAPLTWDGAFQLNVTLIGGKPFVYLTRFHTLILWQPVALSARFISNPQVLWALYGMPFLGAPVLSILLCWWLVRRHAPRLMVWVLFGVAISPLPGQIFVINDSILQQHLFWPLFVSLFVPLDWKKWLAVGVLAVFQFAHPVGLVLFFIISAAAVAMIPLDHARWRQLVLRAALGAVLGALAVWKVFLWVDPYAAKEANWEAACRCWHGGVVGLPLHALAWMWASAVLLLVAHRLPAATRVRTIIYSLALVPALVGGGIFVHWAADAHRWAWAIEYRRWVVPMSATFYLLCWLDVMIASRLPPSARRTAPARLLIQDGVALVVLAVIFSLTLGLQSQRYGAMVDRLHGELDRTPGEFVPDVGVRWGLNTPLEHWGTTDLAIAIQGKQTRKLLLSAAWIRIIYNNLATPDNFPDPETGIPRVLHPLFANDTIYPIPFGPNETGWYDMRKIVSPPRPMAPATNGAAP